MLSPRPGQLQSGQREVALQGEGEDSKHSCVGHACLVATFGWIRSFASAQQLYCEKTHCLETQLELLLLEA